MSLPSNTFFVLQFMFPNGNTAANCDLVDHGVGCTINRWDVPGVPQPSEAAIVAAAASPEFAAWFEERTDPVKNAKRVARIWLQSADPVAVAMRTVIAELGGSLRQVRGASGLTNRSDEQFLADVLAKLK